MNQLCRDMKNAQLGGVCAGLANYFGVDPTLIRIVFVVSVLVYGVGLLPYLILWLLMPACE